MNTCGKHQIGSRLGIEAQSSYRFIGVVPRPCGVAARDNHEVRVFARINRRADFLYHLIGGKQFRSDSRMFAELVIFDMDCRHPSMLESLYGLPNIRGVVESILSIRNNRNLYSVHNASSVVHHLGHTYQTDVGTAPPACGG